MSGRQGGGVRDRLDSPLIAQTHDGDFVTGPTLAVKHDCRILGAATMGNLHDLEKQIDSLSRAEKARLLETLVRDLGDAFPGIESRPGVCGGEPCIVRTRIPVWVLEQSRRSGISEADLLKSYPSLRAEDLAQAWAYVRSHVVEIEKQIADNESA
jgi:uncharacterized protein (DUF433 family)